MKAITNASLILSSVHDSSVTRVALFSQYQKHETNINPDLHQQHYSSESKYVITILIQMLKEWDKYSPQNFTVSKLSMYALQKANKHG